MKGKKQCLHNDDDVDEMYAKHAGRHNIQLWAHFHVKVSSKKGEWSFEGHKKSLVEVDEKYKYTPEQLRMWAHMVHLGKHDSLDEPQDKPFWCGY
jgi:hypothetical protein